MLEGTSSLKKIEGHSINSPVKQFYCKNCKITTDVIYKDEKGNTYCDRCKPVTNTGTKHIK